MRVKLPASHLNDWPVVMTFSTDIHVPQRMNHVNLHGAGLSSATTQVKMSILHTGWVDIIIAVDVHGALIMKNIDFENDASFTVTYLWYKISNLISSLQW